MGRSSGKYPSRTKINKKKKMSKSRKLYWCQRKQADQELAKSKVQHDHMYNCSENSAEHNYVAEQQTPGILSVNNIEKTENLGEIVHTKIIEEGIIDEEPVLDEFSFISQEDYDCINNHDIEVETVVTPNDSKSIVSDGNRIVNLRHVLSWSMRLQSNHSKKCSVGQMVLIKEELKGLVSLLTFECDFCGYTSKHSTHENDDSQYPHQFPVNISGVWATISTGNTFSNLKEKLSIMEIPPLTYNVFHKIENELGEKWEESLWSSIEKAGQEEYDIALYNGQRDEDGDVWVTVYTDCGWAYRSYGHSYNASSGVAVIIGKATGKILFLGVRNKYCSICARAENKSTEPTPHLCYKNWNSSSGAMEADIIVQGFKSSLQMHNLKYLKFIADGDSSVYSKIKKDVAYGQIVTKIHCTNHAVKNYGKALYSYEQN